MSLGISMTASGEYMSGGVIHKKQNNRLQRTSHKVRRPLNRDVRQDAMKFCYDSLSMAYDENLTLATLAPIIRTKTPGEQL
jgi:hypothetical protein